jgi:hypothetical protein
MVPVKPPFRAFTEFTYSSRGTGYGTAPGASVARVNSSATSPATVSHFDGDPDELLPAYQRMLEKFGLETLDIHLCITRDGGLTVFYACPTKQIYEEFTRSETFLGAIAEAGLPVPRVSGLGDIQVAHVRQAIRP